MSEEKSIREKAREAIRTHRLPGRSPDRVWGGPGSGAECAICGEAISPEEVELEIEFTRANGHGGNGHDGGSKTYMVHLRCFSILEEERPEKPAPAPSAAPPGGPAVRGELP